MHRFTAGTVVVALHSRLLCLTNMLYSLPRFFLLCPSLPVVARILLSVAACTRAYPKNLTSFVRLIAALAADTTA